MKEHRPSDSLYHILLPTFATIVILSNILSAKLVLLPYFHLEIPAGLFFYPVTFLLSDFVTEVFGKTHARFMVVTSFIMSILSFAMIELALYMPSLQNVSSFQETLGTSGLRIFSSLVAYLIAQLIGIQVYALLKQLTSPKRLWLRNNGATSVSQLIDTIAIDIIFLYWGLQMPLSDVIPIMIFSYCFKIVFSLATTPFFYLGVHAVRKGWWQAKNVTKPLSTSHPRIA